MTRFILAAAAASVLAAASLPVQAASGFATPSRATQGVKVTCSTASACDKLIAKCVERDGTWTPSAHNGQGQPSKGSCTFPAT